MATQSRSKIDTLKSRLIDNGHRFSFFQAYRLLRQLGFEEGRTDTEIKTRPNPSLAFPESDISSITQNEDGDYALSVNFLGLYGVSSPLPTFYSEDILDETQHEQHARREFLDIIGQTIYPLFFRAWLKSRPHLRIVEFDDQRLLDNFYSFVGIPNPSRYREQPGFESLLRFASIYLQQPRSALGLKTIISSIYPELEVNLIEQDIRVLNIPEVQRMYLGQQATILGEDTHIGEQYACRTSNLLVELRNVSSTLFQQLLPGEYEFRRLQFLVRHYLTDPLNIAVDLYLTPGAVRQAGLGAGGWSKLGKDTWLVSRDADVADPVRILL